MKGKTFRDENGLFEVVEETEDDPFDYYVEYLGANKPDKIGKRERELEEAELVEE